MKVKEFVDKYDKEFVNLMLEIDKRTENFCKSDTLKINSWVKALCLPSTSIPWKKNRNLYSILLLDSIINGKLEPPFNKFANDGNELPMLSPSVVKSKISSKFTNEVSFNNSDEQIQHFINLNWNQQPIEYNNVNVHINSNNQNNIVNKPKQIKQKQRIENNNNKQNVFNNKVSFNNEYNEMPIQNQRVFINQQDYLNNIPLNINDADNKHMNSKSDVLLKKKYFGIKDKLKNERGFQIKTKPVSNKMEVFKLESMIKFLENEREVKSQIIEQQGKDLKELRAKVSQLERKVNSVFGIKNK